MLQYYIQQTECCILARQTPQELRSGCTQRAPPHLWNLAPVRLWSKGEKPQSALLQHSAIKCGNASLKWNMGVLHTAKSTPSMFLYTEREEQRRLCVYTRHIKYAGRSSMSRCARMKRELDRSRCCLVVSFEIERINAHWAQAFNFAAGTYKDMHGACLKRN